MIRAILIYRGKYLTVRRFSGVPEMCAVEIQQSTNEFTVDIWERENQLALCFWYENQQYLPNVDGGNLKLEKVVDAVDGSSATASNIPDSFWFVKENSEVSGCYYLRAVAEPKKYIAQGNSSNRQSKFKLSVNQEDFIIVEQQRASTTTKSA